MKPGFDQWLTPEWLAIEEAHWGMSIILEQGAYLNARTIHETMDMFPDHNTIIEYGCGTGWIPWLLRYKFHQSIFSYHGIDSNPYCLRVAEERNPLDHWTQADLLKYPAVVGYDIACTFSVMKHIRLEEWRTVWSKIIGSAPITVAGLNMCKHSGPVEDGTAYVHNWVPESWIFDGSRRVHYLRKNWEGEHGSDILVVLVDPELYNANSEA